MSLAGPGPTQSLRGQFCRCTGCHQVTKHDSVSSEKLGNDFDLADEVERAGHQKSRGDDAVRRVRKEDIAGDLLFEEAAVGLVIVE